MRMILAEAPFTAAQIEEIFEIARENGCAVLTPENISECPDAYAADAEILCGYFPPRILKNAEQLRWLQLPCAGADRYVSDGLYHHPDFTLTNSSGAFGTAIAEQLLMGTLMLLRKMPVYRKQQTEKLWRRDGNLGFLHGSRVTVLGTGNLGGTFARYAKALGAIVTGVSRSGTSENPAFAKIYPTSEIHEAVKGARVVAACLPLTDETEGLLDEKFFAAMDAGSFFLNTGRGKTVNQQALIDALASGHLGGAMLDVAETEPMPRDCPLWDMENVIITPHISGSDLDPMNGELIFGIFRDNLRAYFAGNPLQNVVDRRKGY